jgi:hypothetical protein
MDFADHSKTEAEQASAPQHPSQKPKRGFLTMFFSAAVGGALGATALAVGGSVSFPEGIAVAAGILAVAGGCAAGQILNRPQIPATGYDAVFGTTMAGSAFIGVFCLLDNPVFLALSTGMAFSALNAAVAASVKQDHLAQDEKTIYSKERGALGAIAGTAAGLALAFVVANGVASGFPEKRIAMITPHDAVASSGSLALQR